MAADLLRYCDHGEAILRDEHSLTTTANLAVIATLRETHRTLRGSAVEKALRRGRSTLQKTSDYQTLTALLEEMLSKLREFHSADEKAEAEKLADQVMAACGLDWRFLSDTIRAASLPVEDGADALVSAGYGPSPPPPTDGDAAWRMIEGAIPELPREISSAYEHAHWNRYRAFWWRPSNLTAIAAWLVDNHNKNWSDNNDEPPNPLPSAKFAQKLLNLKKDQLGEGKRLFAGGWRPARLRKKPRTRRSSAS